MRQVVSYMRVSTGKQGKSGLWASKHSARPLPDLPPPYNDERRG
jgi:hypothetical protein